MKNDILRSQPLFAGLPDSEIQNLTETLPVCSHRAGDIVDEESVDLPSNAILLIYTDGLNEPLEERDKAFDLVGLCATLLAVPAPSAQEICAGLGQTVKSHTGNAPAQDDFTALVICIS
jgi:hypothetical protein